MPWIAPAQVLRQKTHCIRGHELCENNVYRNDDGWRRCKECRRLAAKANYWREREAAA
jgi:hypothetical protein